MQNDKLGVRLAEACTAGLRYVDPRSAKLRPNVRISLAHALARKLSQKLHRIHIEIRNFVRVQDPYQYYRGFI